MSNHSHLAGQDPLPPDTPIPKKNRQQKLLALGLILLITGGGFLLARQLVESKPTADRKTPRAMKTVVQVTTLQSEDVTGKIEAMGTVLAAEELALMPWISGRVEYITPALTPGGRLKKGDVILKLNPEDYKLALERSRNSQEKARMDLRLEEGNQAVAKREYELIREYSKTPAKETPMDLALRKPQLAKAKAVLAAAKTEVERAELDLNRTVLRAPFDAVVLKKEVAVGSQVSPRTTVALLAGSETFHIRVSVPRRDLDQIQLPKKDEPPPEVEITTVTATGQSIHYRGRLLRLLGDVDPKGLMPRLLVEVKDPLEQQPDHPLLLGSVVTLSLPGKTLMNCCKIPRSAVRADNTVLLVDENNRLEIRPVQSSRQDDEFIYVTKGVETGDQIILSPVAAPVAGMELTVTGDKIAQEKKPRD